MWNAGLTTEYRLPPIVSSSDLPENDQASKSDMCLSYHLPFTRSLCTGHQLNCGASVPTPQLTNASRPGERLRIESAVRSPSSIISMLWHRRCCRRQFHKPYRAVDKLQLPRLDVEFLVDRYINFHWLNGSSAYLAIATSEQGQIPRPCNHQASDFGFQTVRIVLSGQLCTPD